MSLSYCEGVMGLLVLLIDGLALLILFSSRSIQIYPSFLRTPTRRAFTSDPLVRLHCDRSRSLDRKLPVY